MENNFLFHSRPFVYLLFASTIFHSISSNGVFYLFCSEGCEIFDLHFLFFFFVFYIVLILVQHIWWKYFFVNNRWEIPHTVKTKFRLTGILLFDFLLFVSSIIRCVNMPRSFNVSISNTFLRFVRESILVNWTLHGST